MSADQNQLQIAKRLADESGRHISECMAEAAELIIADRTARRAPRVRLAYLGFLVLFLILAISGLLGALSSGPAFAPGLSVALLGVGLAGVFWFLPELPLLTRTWTRWNTPLLLFLAILALVSEANWTERAFELAKFAYFTTAAVAAISGSLNPQRAIGLRNLLNPLAFHTLAPRDQQKVFFLAPWVSPFTWRRTKSK